MLLPRAWWISIQTKQLWIPPYIIQQWIHFSYTHVRARVCLWHSKEKNNIERRKECISPYYYMFFSLQMCNKTISAKYQLDLHFTHHIQCTIPWINTFLVHEYVGRLYIFVTYIHILEKRNVVENKFISILIPSLSLYHTQL